MTSKGVPVPRPTEMLAVFQQPDSRIEHGLGQAAHVGGGIDPRLAGFVEPQIPASIPARESLSSRGCPNAARPCTFRPVRPRSCRCGPVRDASRRSWSCRVSTGPSIIIAVDGIDPVENKKFQALLVGRLHRRGQAWRCRCKTGSRRPGCQRPGRPGAPFALPSGAWRVP